MDLSKTIFKKEAALLREQTEPAAGSASASKKRRLRLLAVFLILALLAGGCLWYLETYYRADEAAVAAFSADLRVEERTLENGDLTFGSGTEPVGLIFYPGGKVEHRAYIPLMRLLARNGVFCVLCEMPFRLAVLDPDAAEGIPEAWPEVGSWYIGGHSLGGVIAASWLSDHREGFEGLILLASYSTADLSDSGLRVLSIRGSEDGILDPEKYEASRPNLPADAREEMIRGGCHAGFGMYGPQTGDGEPSLSAGEQIRAAADLILAWLRETGRISG